LYLGLYKVVVVCFSPRVLFLFPMSLRHLKQLFIGSSRGLNDSDKCTDVKMNLSAQPLHIVCLQESKLVAVPPAKATTFLPSGFSSYSIVPSVGAAGGVITVWDPCAVVHVADRPLEFSLSSQFELAADGTKLSVTNVYAPCDRARRDAFLSELRSHADLGGEPGPG
jgi:hypothetical protein